MKAKLMTKGLVTFVPGIRRRILKKKSEGTCSARYCYSIWLRHLKKARENALSSHPKSIVELGPGDSLGTGIAALISGSDRYYALDAVYPSHDIDNTRIFDELVELFRKRDAIPGEREFPLAKPYLESYDFPYHVLDKEYLVGVMTPERLEDIEAAISRCMGENDNGSGRDGISIRYIVPWTNTETIAEGSIDMVFSQAVLEHVEDLRGTYEFMYRWLRPGGVISHQIDFKCHGSAGEWNGHWEYSEFVWKVIKLNRPYLLNRKLLSSHLRIMEDVGFRVVCTLPIKDTTGIGKSRLSSRWKDMSDEDLTCSGVFVQAVK